MQELTNPGPDALAHVTLNGLDDYCAPRGAAPGEIMAIDWHDFDTEWYAHISFLPQPGYRLAELPQLLADLGLPTAAEYTFYLAGAAEATYPLPVVDLRGTASATEADIAHVSYGRVVLGRGDDEHEAMMGKYRLHA